MKISLRLLKPLLLFILLNFVFMDTFLFAQRPIVITADQPNIWTLEQAHYLLAQMHRRNLDLKAQSLEALDPNAINGVNMDVLKSLLEVAVEFDEIKGFGNKQIKTRSGGDLQRRDDLIRKRSVLEDNSVRVTARVAELTILKGRSDDEEVKSDLQSQIDELGVVQGSLRQQIDSINMELSTLTVGTGSMQGVAPNAQLDRSKLAGSLDSLFATTATTIANGFANAPQLNASLRLENYLQMQYEILSKQLTLLRDEVGPGERLIFLEMPQSINASHDKANNKWAQSWWRISGYSKCVIATAPERWAPCSAFLESIGYSPGGRKTTMSEITSAVVGYTGKPIYYEGTELLAAQDLLNVRRIVEAMLRPENNQVVTELKRASNEDRYGGLRAFVDIYEICVSSKENIEPPVRMSEEDVRAKIRAIYPTLAPAAVSDTRTFLKDLSCTKSLAENEIFLRESLLLLFNDYIEGRLPRAQQQGPKDSRVKRRLMLENTFSGGVQKWENYSQEVISFNDENPGSNGPSIWSGIKDRQIRVVDLFPRQSSLNVNSLNLRSNAFSLKGIFTLIVGFGANGGYQQTRERYSQFVQQELYSSGFGKGAREFGWTFNPMPGMKRLSSGTRTTYAIAIVPEDATGIIMDSRGCYFPRAAEEPRNFSDAYSSTEPNRGCESHSRFFVPIPEGGADRKNGFSVNEIHYKPVNKGGKIVVTISGRNFSSQIGLLVDGYPLKQALGLGQPFILDDSAAGQSVISTEANLKIRGSFERIGSNQIVATFEMPDSYEGTPTISLITPGNSQDLRNFYNIKINGTFPTDLAAAEYMFGRRIGTSDKAVRVDKVSVFKTSNDKRLRAAIVGTGLDQISKIYVNGVEHGVGVANPITVKRTLITFDFDKPDDKSISFALVTGPEDTLTAGPVENPAIESSAPVKFKVNKEISFIDYQTKPDGSEWAVVQITGIGLDNAKTDKGEFIAVSSTEGLLKLLKSALPDVITVSNKDDPKLKSSIVVTNRAPDSAEEKEAEKEKGKTKRESPLSQ
jgi:hypothetical protein